jgi:DNA polymerase
MYTMSIQIIQNYMEGKMLQWEELYKKCQSCSRCRLGSGRKNVVFGEGAPNAAVMFVGEAPGADEDISGRPFVGKAGQLMDLALNANGFYRNENFYICNICKCRPEKNRTPFDDEAETCLNYLRNQVWLVKPQIIVCLGSTAMKYIIDKNEQITKIRGQWIERKGTWIMPTFHPAALLRDESKKIPFWEDIKNVRLKYRELRAAKEQAVNEY